MDPISIKAFSMVKDLITQKGPPFTSLEPINKQATPEARKLLQYLYQIKAAGETLSGNHNWNTSPMGGMITAYNEQGVYPTVQDMEIGRFEAAYATDEAFGPLLTGVINAVITAWQHYRIPVFCWHMCYPGAPIDFDKGVKRQTTDAEFDVVITPGSDLYKLWEKEVDFVAGYLKVLRDANVPAIIRPFHEMNGQWFWYGCKTNFVKLWDNFYDRLVNYHQLHNLLWFWNWNAPNGYTDQKTGVKVFEYNDKRTFGGVERADIFGVDIYTSTDTKSYQQKFYDDMVAITGGKICTIGENGQLPSPTVLKTQPWAWFATWPDYWTKEGNTKETRTATYTDPSVVNNNKVSMMEFLGYDGAEISIAKEADVVRPVVGLPDSPAAVGQIAVVGERFYAAKKRYGKEAFVELARAGEVRITSDSGNYRFQLHVDDTGALTADKLTLLRYDFSSIPDNSDPGTALTGQKAVFTSGTWIVLSGMLTTKTGYNGDTILWDAGQLDYRIFGTLSGMFNANGSVIGYPNMVIGATADMTYYLQVKLANNVASITKKTPAAGDTVTLISKPFPTENGAVYEVELVRQNNVITVFVNDVEILSYTMTDDDIKNFSTNLFGYRYNKSGTPTVKPNYGSTLTVEKP